MGESFYEYKKFGGVEYKLQQETNSDRIVEQTVRKLRESRHHIRVIHRDGSGYKYGIYGKKV